MIDCKYNADIVCMNVNSFPESGKIHNRCLICEHLDKDLQISILAHAFMWVVAEECCIYNQDEAYDIARARVAREEGKVVAL